jgi:type II secretory pathway component GspD/PulD (secretin)
VLNNQTATLKVSEDFVYFNVKQDVVPGTTNTNATVTTTTTPQSVSIGFFMSLTAQISDNGTVTLSVRPSISSIAELKQDPNPELAKNNIKNLVPQIRMREIESMMRVESGDIAVLGGLMEDRLDNKAGSPARPWATSRSLARCSIPARTRRQSRNSSFSCARR